MTSNTPPMTLASLLAEHQASIIIHPDLPAEETLALYRQLRAEHPDATIEAAVSGYYVDVRFLLDGHRVMFSLPSRKLGERRTITHEVTSIELVIDGEVVAAA